MKNIIKYGSQQIEFQLKYSDRKTLGITVKPDLSVIVSAPSNASLHSIKAKIIKKAGWIIKHQNYFKSFHPLTPQRKYVNGESHLYLGRRYRLKIKKSLRSEVKINSGFMNVGLNNHFDKSAVQKTIEAWYKERAEVIFNKILLDIPLALDRNHIPLKPISIRYMKSRWGSCTASKRIIINTSLIKAPKKCIEYVIIHEMCHLKQPNHGKAFYNLQSKLMPDWEYWKNKLELIMS